MYASSTQERGIYENELHAFSVLRFLGLNCSMFNAEDSNWTSRFTTLSEAAPAVPRHSSNCLTEWYYTAPSSQQNAHLPKTSCVCVGKVLTAGLVDC